MKLLDSPPVVEQSVNPNDISVRQETQCFSTSKNVIPIEPPPTVNSLTEKLISSFRTCGLRTCTSDKSHFANSSYIQDTNKPFTLIYQAYFGIKYYPADPTIIADEQTRYQVFMQVRNDLINDRMQVDENLFVTLCGLILQSDCGDYGADRLGPNYVKQLLKLPNLDEQLEKKIKSKHEECRCRQPALVEYQLLDKVKQLPTYGQIKFHIKETISNTPCLLCLGPTGVIIEDSGKNLIKFSWPQITGFGHKHKQVLIKILNEGTRFTYCCSVDNSMSCENLLEICKNYLNFYRNEISQRIINEPQQLMANTTSAQPSSTSVQPIFYRKTSLITTSGTAYNANEPNLLPDAKCPVYATTDSTQPASNEFESKINVKVNRNLQPLYSSLIEFTPGYAPPPPPVQYPMCSSTVCSSQYPHSQPRYHHPHAHCFDARSGYPAGMAPASANDDEHDVDGNINGDNVNKCYYHHYYCHPHYDNNHLQNTMIPMNPYHVNGTGMVFHRPRGCKTVTDIGDHPHVYSNRRSHYLQTSYASGRWIVNDNVSNASQCRLRHRRKSFPKTKHYYIDEDIDGNYYMTKVPPSYHDDDNDTCGGGGGDCRDADGDSDNDNNNDDDDGDEDADDCNVNFRRHHHQHHHLRTSRSKSASIYGQQEFYQANHCPPCSLSSSCRQRQNRHPVIPEFHHYRRQHRILPRPVSRLDRYPELSSSIKDENNKSNSEETIEYYDGNNNNKHNSNNHDRLHCHFNESMNYEIPRLIKQNKLNGVKKCEVLQVCSASRQSPNENYSQCNSPRDNRFTSSRRQTNGNSSNICSPRSSTSMTNRSNTHSTNSNELRKTSLRKNHPSTISYWHKEKANRNTDTDDDVFVDDNGQCKLLRVQHPPVCNTNISQNNNAYNDESDREEGDQENKVSANIDSHVGDLNKRGLLHRNLFASTNATDYSFSSSVVFCPEGEEDDDESQTPSLLKNSENNSELYTEEVFETSFTDFKLPPTPNSPGDNNNTKKKYNNDTHNQNQIINEHVEEVNSDSNLPSPPSNDFLVQLEKYKFKTDKQSEVFRNNNLENTNQKANTLENISSDTGFSSRGDNSNNHNNNNTNNKRGRRLPLLPYERSSHHGKLNDLDQFTTSTPTAQAKEVVTTTAATSTPLPEPTEATKINRPKMIQLLSPTPSPRLLKGIRNYHHHQYQKRLSTNHCQLEDTPEHDQTTECDLV